jgi:ankyrin repeat protein
MDKEALDELFSRVGRQELIEPEYIEIVKNLIKNKDIYILHKINIAVEHNLLEVVRLFLAKEEMKSFIGKKFSDDNDYSILHVAFNIMHYNSEMVKFLIEISPIELLKQVDKFELTVLHEAANRLHIDAMRFLITELPVLIKNRDDENRTFLHYVLYNIHQDNLVDVLKFLFSIEEIRSNTELICAQDDKGNTILHLAVIDRDKYSEMQLEVLKFLFSIEEIRNNTKLICAQNIFGYTILHLAVIVENEAVIKLLIEQAPQDLFVIKDNTGKTALDLAAVGSQMHELLSGTVDLMNQDNTPRQQETSHVDRLAAERNDGQYIGYIR